MEIIRVEDIELPDEHHGCYICKKLTKKNITYDFFEKLDAMEDVHPMIQDEGLCLYFKTKRSKDKISGMLNRLIIGTRKELTIIYDYKLHMRNSVIAGGAGYFLDELINKLVKHRSYADRYKWFILNKGKRKLILLTEHKKVLDEIPYDELGLVQI